MCVCVIILILSSLVKAIISAQKCISVCLVAVCVWECALLSHWTNSEGKNAFCYCCCVSMVSQWGAFDYLMNVCLDVCVCVCSCHSFTWHDHATPPDVPMAWIQVDFLVVWRVNHGFLIHSVFPSSLVFHVSVIRGVSRTDSALRSCSGPCISINVRLGGY